MEHLMYPIGRFSPKADYSAEEVATFLTTIETYPQKLRDLVAGKSAEDCKKYYREGSWDVAQLLHHLADMQLFYLVRSKMALTEENPAAPAVQINAWGHTPEAINPPVEPSLAMIEATHVRLSNLFRSLNDEQLNLTYFHPARQVNLSIKQTIYMAAWHIEHHHEHIRIAFM